MHSVGKFLLDYTVQHPRRRSAKYEMSNFMEQSPSREGIVGSASQDIPPPFWDQKIHYL
jgi:hypothetical protein